MYLEDQVVPRQGESTKDTDIASTTHQRGTEKQMISYLKMMLTTHDTGIIIHHKILSCTYMIIIERHTYLIGYKQHT
jgi:hypothetical protein